MDAAARHAASVVQSNRRLDPESTQNLHELQVSHSLMLGRLSGLPIHRERARARFALEKSMIFTRRSIARDEVARRRMVAEWACGVGRWGVRPDPRTAAALLGRAEARPARKSRSPGKGCPESRPMAAAEPGGGPTSPPPTPPASPPPALARSGLARPRSRARPWSQGTPSPRRDRAQTWAAGPTERMIGSSRDTLWLRPRTAAVEQCVSPGPQLPPADRQRSAGGGTQHMRSPRGIGSLSPRSPEQFLRHIRAAELSRRTRLLPTHATFVLLGRTVQSPPIPGQPGGAV